MSEDPFSSKKLRSAKLKPLESTFLLEPRQSSPPHPVPGDGRRLNSILNTVVDAIITLDGEGIMQSVNAAAVALFGYARRELAGRSVSLILPEPWANRPSLPFLEAFQPGRPSQSGHEAIGRRKGGDEFPIELSVSEIEVGNRPLFTVIVRDISERRNVEASILEAGHQEQRRLGQLLHDGIGQQLAGVEFMSQALAQRLVALGLQEAGAARQITELIRQAIGQVRDLAQGLTPVLSEAEGLMVALRQLAEGTAAIYGVTCRFDCATPVLVTDNTMALHLFRMAQEATANALRKPRTRVVEIGLTESRDRYILAVRDDGEHGPESNAEMELRVMQYRTGVLGGSLAFQSHESGGTEMVCSVHKNAASS